MPHLKALVLRMSCLILLQTFVILTPYDGVFAGGIPPQTSPEIDSTPLAEILQYISSGWDRLTRSMTDCDTFKDIKINREPILYFPEELTIPPSIDELEETCHIRVEHLPERIKQPGPNKVDASQDEGLLYLEHPYVVPGGQFNEMYGWDSYFILRGLLRDNRLELAKGMVDDFFFEIEHYGGVLNANRTYYLTRSQPPFLSSMVLAVFDAEKQSGHTDLQWLARAYRYTARDYDQWNRDPHLAGETKLSRYYGYGDGPVPEIIGDPADYYRGVAHYFLIHDGANNANLVDVEKPNPSTPWIGPAFPTYVCDPGLTNSVNAHCAPADRIALTAEFYKGDRSMRESGFDVSFRFGPFGAETHHYAPVGLNSLLYKTEKDLEEMSTLLGRPDNARMWARKAQERNALIVKYLWDAHSGMYFDYNFVTNTRSSYLYATTLYPLWAGLASPEQAKAVVQNLNKFEQAGGLAMSRQETGAQWDYPYGWAPIQLLVVEGLRRYGYKADADRISSKFLVTVLRNFAVDGTIREKYDVVAQSAQTHIQSGYTRNEIGFGWTNGVFLELLHGLSPGSLAQLKEETHSIKVRIEQ